MIFDITVHYNRLQCTDWIKGRLFFYSFKNFDIHIFLYLNTGKTTEKISTKWSSVFFLANEVQFLNLLNQFLNSVNLNNQLNLNRFGKMQEYQIFFGWMELPWKCYKRKWWLSIYQHWQFLFAKIRVSKEFVIFCLQHLDVCIKLYDLHHFSTAN